MLATLIKKQLVHCISENMNKMTTTSTMMSTIITTVKLSSTTIGKLIVKMNNILSVKIHVAMLRLLKTFAILKHVKASVVVNHSA